MVADLLKLAHALLGVAFVGALAGRWVVLGLAERAESLPAMRTLTRAAAPFERMVIVGGGVMVVLGVATAIAQGRPFLGPLQGGSVDWLFVSVLLLLTTVPLPPLVFLPRGRTFEAAMADATARDSVTPGLAAAWRDPVVRAAHVWELGVVTVVLALMISKPF
jgi:hypothetical protein